MTTPSKDLMYVIWTNANIRMGRYITLDAQNRIKTFVPYTRPPTSYADSTMIIPRTGGQLAHMSGRFSVEMPVWVVEACVFHGVKGYSGPFRSDCLRRGKNECVFCATTTQTAHVREVELLLICRSCMLPWHFECATVPQLSQSVGEEATNADFKCALCRVCAV